MLQTVNFCGIEMTRLLIGANPFGGYSHQTPERNEEMRGYYTTERILETWERAEKAGINTFVTNNETPHVMDATRQYLGNGGRLQWIGQLNHNPFDGDMVKAIEQAIDVGACAAYLHGAIVDRMCEEKDDAPLRDWVAYAKSRNFPIGVAGHKPETHYWVADMDIVDFHTVCFFTCGSVHEGSGDKFRLQDMAPASECIQKLDKPCIGYKIMAAGRISARLAFDYAFENIKPGDVVNVGMHRGDKDDMVEENAAIAEHLLAYLDD
ncbi:MAG: hypothetical protein KAI66_06315 [Lentisphaeria bacterium]|nr:hypothetical protein [Lentisphaeria bacterium]